MKTVIVSFYEVFPPTSGAANVTYNVAKYLSGERYLIQLGRNTKNQLLDGSTILISIKQISNHHLIKFINLVIRFPKIVFTIKKLVPSAIILEGASWTFYYLLLFYLMKIVGIKARIIYHAHNVEYLLRKEKNNLCIAMITKWAEGKLMRKSDFATAVSHKDAIKFNQIYSINPMIFPNGVDVRIFETLDADQVQKIGLKYHLNGKIVLFMGLTAFKPNEEGIEFLINDIFPAVVQHCPEAKLAIIGGDLSYKREWLINPGVIPFQEVPAFIKCCDVCVAPIFSGSGTRLKILEYMAAGRPVVSTSKGAEGLDVEDGKNIIIADNADKFSMEIISLIKQKSYAEKIGSEAMQMVQANYSWEQIVNNFIQKLLSLENLINYLTLP